MSKASKFCSIHQENNSNDVYILFWSSWVTFIFLLWMKANLKISQFSRFLLVSEYAIQDKIWKWLKLLNSVPFIKKTLVNQIYIRIWSSWLTFTVLQWMKKNSKISQFLSFMRSRSKFDNDENFFILIHSSRKHL